MDPFKAFAEACIPFFSSVAQVDGGLLGLVFVALTFNTKALGIAGDRGLRDLARQTFSDFLMVLLMALIMLVPNTSPRQIGVILILLAAIGSVRIVLSLAALRRNSTLSSGRLVLQRFGLSLLGHVGIFVAGYLLWTASENFSATGSLLVTSPLALLVSGSRSAWLLVVHQAD